MPLRKSVGPKPQIAQITPPAAIAGGELQIRGKGFARSERPRVIIGEIGASVVIGSDSFVIARVPEGVQSEHAVFTHLFTLGFNALTRGQYRFAENVVVIGLGVVGLSRERLRLHTPVVER